MNESVAITIDGNVQAASTGASVAATLLNAHGQALRPSVTGEPRGPVCGMGVCFECRVTIDGVAQQRSCQKPCQADMRIETRADKNILSIDNSPMQDTMRRLAQERSFDIVVLGAGPGGLAAACVAAEAGRGVAIVADNPDAGGPNWRRDALQATTGIAAAWLARLRKQPITWFAQTTIACCEGTNVLRADSREGPLALNWQQLVLATGARERFVPFPGWTLPGVFGAGGLQALVKAGFGVSGRKIVLAGSGPLLLPVADYLQMRGADVCLIAEQTPFAKFMRFGAALLWRQPSKMLEALSLGWRIRGIPYRTGCWPVRADGGDRLTSVTLTDGERTWTQPCDALACGFGLVPNLELPTLLGCAIADRFVTVDEQQRTSMPNVYAVGELTGIGGVEKALLEGQIAGWSAAGQAERARALHAPRKHAHRFVALLHDAFALRGELRELADADTIICRCEDVRLGALRRHRNARDAKLQTRCGMGSCQGRTCGPIVQQLFGWGNDSIRPPIYPTALGNLL
jgi:NADPH-dependent 2,4-dienoyl-CoA reductase/sulfur reductase-like enzyme